MNNPFKPTEIKIAVIGGGTGSFTLLSALKNHTSQLVALVNMADDGGSTGQLRDEFGALPPGDVRQCLVALSRSPEVRDLFNYRFEAGTFKGHAFGNLFLTALEKLKNGDFVAGVKVASQVLNIVGAVEPITLSNVNLAIKNAKGVEIKGESHIDEADFQSCRPQIWLEPKAKPNPSALGAIANADMVVIAPGQLYNSLAPALLVDGIGEALANSQALKIFVCNLMTKPGQTDNFLVHDFADEINRFANNDFLDMVLFNTERPTAELVKKYAKDGEKPVNYNEEILMDKKYSAIGVKLLSNQIWQSSKNDPLSARRTLIRHDSNMVAKILLDIFVTYKEQQKNDF